MTEPTTNGKTKRVNRVSHLRWVPIPEMRVSPSSQREFKQAHAEEYAANFDLEGFGFPVVNYRDGHWYIVDGQHRVAALRLIGWGDQQIQCEAYEGLTETEEAELFLKRNKRRNIIAFDTFRVGVNAGRQTECDIDRIVRAQGLKISKDDSDGSVSAVASLRRVYDLGGPPVLSRTLKIIRDSYGGHRASFRQELITGIGYVCQRYNGALDDETLSERLSKLPGGALGLVGKAAVTKKQLGKPMAHCVAGAVVDTYNAGRNGKRLESWWK